MFFFCCSYFSLCLFAPLSGWLRDITGSYICSFVLAGVFLVVGTAITTTLPNFCSCTDPLPLSPKKKTKNELTERELLKQVLSSDSTENIQNTDRIPETRSSQNHITEPDLEVDGNADQTEDDATC